MKTDAIVLLSALAFLAIFWTGYVSGKHEHHEVSEGIAFFATLIPVLVFLIAFIRLLAHAFAQP